MELLEISFGMKITIIWGNHCISHLQCLLCIPPEGVLLSTEPSHNLFLIIKRFCEIQLSSCDRGPSLKQHPFHWINEIENAYKTKNECSESQGKKKIWKAGNARLENTWLRALLPPGADTKFTAVRLTPLCYSVSCPFLFPSVSVLLVCSVVGCSMVGAQSRFLQRHAVLLCVKLPSGLFVFTSCI